MPYLVSTLSIPDLEARALEFRRRFAPDVVGPLGIDRLEAIVEFDLGLDIVPTPGLIERTGTRAAFSADGRHILVDAAFQAGLSLDYFQVLLHEGCHGVLHRRFVPPRPPGGRDAFVSFHRSIDPGTVLVLETEATDLARRIAMPTPELQVVFARARGRARDYAASVFDMKFDPERQVAVAVAEHFGVTTRWAQERLRELWRAERDANAAPLHDYDRMAPRSDTHGARLDRPAA